MLLGLMLGKQGAEKPHLRFVWVFDAASKGASISTE